ncbi:MAG TPA: magnesium transporter [archaeon]|nr:magnesium transporter [archaeon]
MSRARRGAPGRWRRAEDSLRRDEKVLASRLRRRVRALPRRKQHPLVHHIHRKHAVSYRTLFYMKEYGPRSHVAHVILRESLGVVLLAAIISSIGGVALQGIGSKLVGLAPLLVLLPALNNMVGSFGTVLSSKFSNRLQEGLIQREWWRDRDTHQLFASVLAIALVAVVYVTGLAFAVAAVQGSAFSVREFVLAFEAALVAAVALVCVISLVAFLGGELLYRRGEDPDNFLIPLTTAIGDLGSMVLFSSLVALLF